MSRGLVLVALLSLLGCAPPAHLRPGALPLGTQSELGAAAVAVTPRPYVDEPTSHILQAWYTARLSERWSWSVIGAADTWAGLLGGALSVQALQLSPLTASVEIEGGVLWAAMSLPIELRVPGELRFYVAPKVGHWGPRFAPFIPVGLSAPLLSGISLRAEVMWSWADLEYYNARLHGSAGLAYAW